LSGSSDASPEQQFLTDSQLSPAKLSVEKPVQSMVGDYM
jgi:hypothetical protein